MLSFVIFLKKLTSWSCSLFILPLGTIGVDLISVSFAGFFSIESSSRTKLWNFSSTAVMYSSYTGTGNEFVTVILNSENKIH